MDFPRDNYYNYILIATCQVTSLETIHEDSDCNDIPYLCQELQNLSGLVACGTKQGNIYLIGELLIL